MRIDPRNSSARYPQDSTKNGGGLPAPKPPDPSASSYVGAGRQGPPGADAHAGQTLPAAARSVAECVLSARSLIADLERDYRGIPPYASELSPRSGELNPLQLLGDARRVADSLPRGAGLDAVAAELVSERARTNVSRLVTRLWEERNRMRLICLYYSLEYDRPAIEEVKGRVTADISRWAEENGATEDAQVLGRAVDDYIAYWLHVRRGERPLRLTFDPDALEYAVIRMRYAVLDTSRETRLNGLIPRLINYLKNEEARRIRLPNDAPAGTDEAASAVATPLTRSVRNLEEMGDVIGQDLVGRFNEYYERLRTNAEGSYPSALRAREVAIGFYEMFFTYIRYFVNTYGDRSASELSARGIETPLVHAVFLRTQNSKLYDDDVLAAFRSFFVLHVRGEEPQVAALKAPRGTFAPDVPRALGDGREYVPYEGEMSMRQYFSQIRGWLGSYRAQFEAAVGVTLDTFLSWGETQEKPAEFTDEAWAAHVRQKIETGNREDVTTEPFTYRSWDAIYPAYRFLQRVASTHGQVVDFFDFLCAIFPVARRLRQQAVDGVIHITAPGFMRDVDRRNWDISSFAREMSRRAASGEVATLTPERTMKGHRERDIKHPSYETLRLYATALSAARQGGVVQSAAMYECIAGLLRLKELVDVGLSVVDSDDSLITHRAHDAVSRFQIMIDYDNATYSQGKTALSTSQQRVFADARNGAYRRRLDAVRDYLEGIRMLPRGYTARTPRGDDVDLSELDAELESLDALERLNTATLKDRSQTFSLSEEDVERVFASYSKLDDFVRRVFFFTSVHSEVAIQRGVIRYETLPFSTGDAVREAMAGYVEMPLNALLEVARTHNLDRGHFSDLVMLHAIIERERTAAGLQIRDDPAGIREAISDYWPEERPIPDKVLEAYAGVLTHISRERLDVRLPGLPRGSLGDRHSGFLPRLPDSAPRWDAQFRDFARGRIRCEDIPNAVRAITEYLYSTPNSVYRFYPTALRAAIGAFANGSAVTENIYRTVVDFFRTIAVASEDASSPPVSSHDTVSAGEVAEWAAALYVRQFHELQDADVRDEIVLDPDLLMRIVALELDEHRALASERSSIYRMARRIVERFNEGAGRTDGRDASRPPLEVRGRLESRIRCLAPLLADEPILESSVRRIMRAHYALLPKLRERRAITPNEITDALEDVSAANGFKPQDAALLGHLLRDEALEIERVRSLIRDPKEGFASYVLRASPRESVISSERLSAFAENVFIQAIVQSGPVDVALISKEAVADGYSPLVADRMAEIYRLRLANWARVVSEKMKREFQENAMLGLQFVALDEEHPAASFDEFVERAMSEVNLPAFDAVSLEDRTADLFQMVAGSEPSGQGLMAAARDIYQREVIPKRNKFDERMRQYERELSQILKDAAGFMPRLAGVIESPTLPQGLDGMAEEELVELISRMERAGELLSGLKEEMGALAASRTRAYELEDALGREHVAAGAIDSSLAGADQALARAVKMTIETKEAALIEIANRREAQRQREAGELSLKVTRAAKRLDAKTREISGHVAEFERFERNFFASEFIRSAYAFMDAVEAADGFKTAGNVAAAQSTFGSASHKFAEKLSSFERDLKGQREAVGQLIEKAQLLLGRVAGADRAILESSIDGLEGAVFRIDHAIERISFHRREARDVEAVVQDKQTAFEAGFAVFQTVSPSELAATDLGFDARVPERSPQTKAHERIGPILQGKILLRGVESFLLPKGQADAVQKWMESGRVGAVTLRDVFGREIRLEAGEFRVGLVSRNDDCIPENHPSRILTGCLEAVANSNTREADLLSRLLAVSQAGKPGAEALFADLMAVFAREERLATPDHALLLTRRWAVANEERLKGRDALGVAARVFFVDVPRQETSVPERSAPIYGDEYGVKTHLQMAERSEAKLRRLLTRESSKDQEFDAPEKTVGAILVHKILSDPTLTGLGYLLLRSYQKKLSPAFEAFFQRLFTSYSWLCFDKKEPISLHELEAIAVDAYLRFSQGAERVSEPLWIDAGSSRRVEAAERLDLFLPENLRVTREFKSFFELFMQRARHRVRGEAEEMIEGCLAAASKFAFLKGVIALDYFLASYLEERGVSWLKSFYLNRAAIDADDDWLKHFILRHTSPAYLTALRAVLQMRVEELGGLHKSVGLFLSGFPGETVAHLVTGVDKPWLPEAMPLPPEDDGVWVSRMGLEAVAERIARLHILPENPREQDALVAGWRAEMTEEAARHASSSEAAQKIAALPVEYAKLSLIITALSYERGDFADRYRAARTEGEGKSGIELVREAYQFLCDNRDAVMKRRDRAALRLTLALMDEAAIDRMLENFDIKGRVTEEGRARWRANEKRRLYLLRELPPRIGSVDNLPRAYVDMMVFITYVDDRAYTLKLLDLYRRNMAQTFGSSQPSGIVLMRFALEFILLHRREMEKRLSQATCRAADARARKSRGQMGPPALAGGPSIDSSRQSFETLAMESEAAREDEETLGAGIGHVAAVEDTCVDDVGAGETGAANAAPKAFVP